MTETRWYHSRLADGLRSVLQGRVWALVMVVAIFFALFLPEISTLAGNKQDYPIDVVLTLIMVVFAIEMCCLTVVDANYMFSFFQLMDIIGTISMIFDITIMLGNPANEPVEVSDGSSAEKKLMLLRASRAARVGARAGRLSRVLRFLRYLPFLSAGSADQDESKTGIGMMISGQLANLLATRVACLTIILVMVIPIFDFWTWPSEDYSLQTWVNRISSDVSSGRLNESWSDLRLMEDFYYSYSYGPYNACEGYWSASSFFCNATSQFNREMPLFWVPSKKEPPRLASTLIVRADNFMVQFNMHSTKTSEAWFQIGTVAFIVVVMVFSGMALSSAVMEIAVRPLERMLQTVRTIASTVFKFTAEVQEGEEEHEEITDIDRSNEMKLLEKVVHKLAIIADLQSAKKLPDTTADMRAEDLGILSMMAGANIIEEKAKNDSRKSMAVPRKRITMSMQVRLEDFGVSQEVFNSWNFNALGLSRAHRTSLAQFIIAKFHDIGDGFINNAEETTMLQRFMHAVEKEYLPVPFHSFTHALDVVHGVSRLLRLIQSGSFLSELEEFALLIAAVGHDIGHPGVNNGFLAEIGHELALQYNDRSPLENMHCAKLYTIIGKPETNVLFKLTKEQYKEVRHICVEAILHTDMMAHQGMVKDLQMMYQMNAEIFIPNPEGNDVVSAAELEVFSQNETKIKVMDCILHSADVSNPCRGWDVSHAWAMACLEEFFAQGDQEKMLGIPVQFLNDRDKLNKPNSQIGFIEFMIAPFYAAQIRLWPPMHELGTNLSTNLQTWQELWEKECNPSEEERAKVKGRVDKVRNNMADAIRRAP